MRGQQNIKKKKISVVICLSIWRNILEGLSSQQQRCGNPKSHKN